MEKQLLYLLDYNLRVTEEELISHLEPFWREESPLATSTTLVTPTLMARRASEQQMSYSPSTTPLKVSIKTLRKSSFAPPYTPSSTGQGQESPMGPSRWTSRYGNNLESPIYKPTLGSSPRRASAYPSSEEFKSLAPAPQLQQRRSSGLSVSVTTTPSSYFHNLHLEAPTPGLARRGSVDSQSSIASSSTSPIIDGTLVHTNSSGQLSLTQPGLPRKASYTARPGSILLVKGDEEPALPSPTSLLKKVISRQPTSLRTLKKAAYV